MARDSPPSARDDLGPSSPAAPSRQSALWTIGWKEYVGLPELGVDRLKAKVDTGARTSALHILNFQVIRRHDDGTAEIEMTVPLDREGSRRTVCRARMIDRIRVTDSGGHPAVRPLIETVLRLGPVSKRIRLTLSDREGMLFRMLLGRKTLEGSFLVDVSGKYLLSRETSEP